MDKNRKLNHIGIIGLGLIGGSFARAFAETGRTVYGCDQQKQTVIDAAESDIFEGVATDIDSFLTFPLDCIYICLPVNAANACIQKLGERNVRIPVTDGVSTKRSIVTAAKNAGLHFCGGHPIRGKETSGFTNSEASLYAGAYHILTPETDDWFAAELQTMHQEIGMKVLVMTPERHDAMFGIISHLPHITAYALMQTVIEVDNEALSYTGGGFRDFTRIAGSDPRMWTDIFLDNKDVMISLIDSYISTLAGWRELIASGNEQDIFSLIEKLSNARRNL